MSEIERFTPGNFGHMLWDKDGGWVRYQDHQAEVERLTAERDKAQAGDDMALSALTSVLRQRYAAQAEIKRMQAELAEAHERCRALELAVEQADEMKAHAEAAATAEESETDRVMAERDAAQAEVERLTVRLEHAQARIVPPLPHADESAQQACDQMATYPRGREVGRFGLDGHYLDAMEPTRPTDEDIWREAYMMAMQRGGVFDRITVADLALAEYRKRWPR